VNVVVSLGFFKGCCRSCVVGWIDLMELAMVSGIVGVVDVIEYDLYDVSMFRILYGRMNT
jgi:hypothetical protein